MHRPRRRGEKGQIFPALLLVVVAIVVFAFAVAQLGSAGDRKTQTQTAADAGALAAAKALVAEFLLGRLTPIVGITGSYASPSTAGYSAAQRAWSVNRPPRPLAPSDVVTRRVDPATVQVTVTAPAGVIADGPVRGAAGTRPVATASATISLTCQPLRSVLNSLLNLVRIQLALPGGRCLEPLPTTTTTVAPAPPLSPPAAPEPSPLTIPLTRVLPFLHAELVA